MSDIGEERVRREQSLRAAILAGDSPSWTHLYESCFADLYAYVRWRCAGMTDVVEEIVQETWLTAIRTMRKFDPREGSFLQWLRGIAFNLLRNHFRRRTRRATEPLDEQSAAMVAPQNGDVKPERIAATLSQLPHRYEDLLRAKYLEGLSVDVIAQARGETPKAVESALGRAREAFREKYLTLEDQQ